jgi:hypothetical protein
VHSPQLFDCFLTRSRPWGGDLVLCCGVLLGVVASRSNTSRLNDDLSDIHSIMKQNINEVRLKGLFFSR